MKLNFDQDLEGMLWEEDAVIPAVKPRTNILIPEGPYNTVESYNLSSWDSIWRSQDARVAKMHEVYSAIKGNGLIFEPNPLNWYMTSTAVAFDRTWSKLTTGPNKDYLLPSGMEKVPFTQLGNLNPGLVQALFGTKDSAHEIESALDDYYRDWRKKTGSSKPIYAAIRPDRLKHLRTRYIGLGTLNENPIITFLLLSGGTNVSTYGVKK